jgi:hypothetical protein
MTEPSGRPSTASSLLTENLGNEDDMSDVTPSDARNVRRVHHKVVEKTVKFRFKPMDRNDEPIHPSALHIKWLHDVQEALGSDIEISQNESVVESDVNTNGNTRNSKDDEIHSLKQEIESLKNERAQYQTNIELQVQEKVAQAIQAHFANIPESVGVTQTQFEVFLEQQNRNFCELSIQLMQMVISTRPSSDSGDHDVVVTVATGKRSGDTTGDTSSMTDSNPAQNDDRKRLDNKPTPWIIRLRQLGYTVQITQSGTVKICLTSRCNATVTIRPSRYHSLMVMMQK